MGVNSGELSFFNPHILLRTLRKNRYNKWTTYNKRNIDCFSANTSRIMNGKADARQVLIWYRRFLKALFYKSYLAIVSMRLILLI